MKDRIYGLETEFGKYRTTPDEPGICRTDNDFVLKKEIKERFPGGFLEQGGLIYVCEGSHPEYATPECRTPEQLVVYDKAGERKLAEISGFRFFKNNTDNREKGAATFGCHENYSVDIGVFEEPKLMELIPFLVTRQIFAGSGKVLKGDYQISQRSDFINSDIGYLKPDTKEPERPVIAWKNDEDHHTSKYRRLHLIVGDSNMSEIATYLKTGTTALVLDLLEGDNMPDIELADPIQALKHISRGKSKNEWLVEARGVFKTGRKNGKNSAIEVQGEYLEKARKYVEKDDATRDLLDRWEYTLDQLENDPMGLSGSVDWVTKKNMLESLMERHGLDWGDKKIRMADIQYHNINPKKGLFYIMQRKGSTDRLMDEEIMEMSIERATCNPPHNTRAWFRGKAVSRGWEIQDWVYIQGKGSKEKSNRTIKLDDPFDTYEHLHDRSLRSFMAAPVE